jgi:hypothetical protein
MPDPKDVDVQTYDLTGVDPDPVALEYSGHRDNGGDEAGEVAPS